MRSPSSRVAMMRLRNILSFLLILGMLLTASHSAAETITLNFKDADIESVIKSVAMITGKTFVIDPVVKGKVTIVSSLPMRADEVYPVFLSILQVHDYAAVETGNVVKIIPLAKAGQDLVIVDQEEKTADLPEDRIVTRIHKLNYIQAEKLVPILRPLLNTRPGQLSAVAVKDGNSLILSDRAGNVERLLRIIKRLDQESAGDIQVVRLEHADAREVVATVGSLEVSSGRLSTDQLRMAADSRTNSVLLAGDEHHVLRIKTLILHLDTPLAREGDTQVIFLRYAKAADLVPILSGIELPDVAGAAAAGASTPRRGGGGSGGQSRSDVNIQADENTNALIVSGHPAALQALQAVVRQLDIRRVQLMIEAVIAEVSTTKGAELGIQWFGADANRTGLIGATNFPASGVPITGIAAQDENSIAALGSLAGLSMGVFSGSAEILGTEFFNLGAFVNALISDSDTNILSTPSLVTMDNQEAEIVVGQNVPFITGSFARATSDTSVNPFQTIERQDVGLKLNVKPQINEGNIIRLDIRQEVSSIEAFRPEGPVTNTRTITTSVMVEDGKVLVLGGLISDDVQETVQRVPVLGHIPLFGALFRYTNTQRQKRNLMVFLRPVILRDEAMSTRVSLDKYDLIRGQQLKRDEKGIPLMPGERQPVLPSFEEFENMTGGMIGGPDEDSSGPDEAPGSLDDAPASLDEAAEPGEAVGEERLID